MKSAAMPASILFNIDECTANSTGQLQLQFGEVDHLIEKLAGYRGRVGYT